MLVMIAACCLGALTVCVIKKLSINYSWGIAIGAGLILQILVVFIGDFRFGVPVSVPELVVGMIGAVIASLIYQLFVFRSITAGPSTRSLRMMIIITM